MSSSLGYMMSIYLVDGESYRPAIAFWTQTDRWTDGLHAGMFQNFPHEYSTVCLISRYIRCFNDLYLI